MYSIETGNWIVRFHEIIFAIIILALSTIPIANDHTGKCSAQLYTILVAVLLLVAGPFILFLIVYSGGNAIGPFVPNRLYFYVAVILALSSIFIANRLPTGKCPPQLVYNLLAAVYSLITGSLSMFLLLFSSDRFMGPILVVFLDALNALLYFIAAVTMGISLLRHSYESVDVFQNNGSISGSQQRAYHEQVVNLFLLLGI